MSDGTAKKRSFSQSYRQGRSSTVEQTKRGISQRTNETDLQLQRTDAPTLWILVMNESMDVMYTVRGEGHARFIEMLEHHAGGSMTRRIWKSIATDLGWTVETVQLYAFQYLSELQHQDEHHTNEITEDIGDNELSIEEDILLESLLAVHLPENGNSQLDWEERVASHLPRTTPLQVRLRFQSRFHDTITANRNESMDETTIHDNTTEGITLDADRFIGSKDGVDKDVVERVHQGERMSELGKNLRTKITMDLVAHLTEPTPVNANQESLDCMSE